MSTSTLAVSTPCYVLMDGKSCVVPELLPLHSGISCKSIYGFSDKGPYDRFCSNGELALTPYPLVKGYLRNQIDASDDGLKLVVLDAPGLRDPCLNAVTMKAALEALENHETHMAVAYRLMFDQKSNAYRVEEASK